MMAAEAGDGAKTSAKGVVAVVIGNWLEFYDFIVFTFFVVMISEAFFPEKVMNEVGGTQEGQFYSLLAALATFWAGFLTRPIGAAVIGAYADRAGRKAAMTLTIMLMALGTAMVALTPGYNALGFWAPVMLVIGRLIQGFSCGGEVGPATSYLLESAPPDRRASLTAWQGTSQQFAGVAGTGLGLILAATLSKEDLYEWGWRVPFLVGLIIGPVGLYIRAVLPETIEKHEAHESSGKVLSTLFSQNGFAVLLVVLCIVGPTISTYMFSYMTTYAIKTLKFSPEVGLFATTLGYIVAIAGYPIGAWLADRFGAKPTLILLRILFVLIVFQGFEMITTEGATPDTLFLVNMVLNLVFALSNGGLYVLLTEAFPKAVRSSGLSIAYAISVTVFGGSAQLIVTWLMKELGDPLVPAWYQLAANVISLLAVLMITSAGRARGVVEAEATG